MGCLESKNKSIEAISSGDIKFVFDACGVVKEMELNDATVSKQKAKYDPRVTAKYEVKGSVGEGSFTSVVWAVNRQTRQPFAIKIYESQEGREAFEAELSILRRVKCPFIIKLAEVFESSDKMYMVMELAVGGSVLDRVKERGTFGEKEAARVLRMVLEGVRYLHTLGITHRDLKPDNLLFYHPGADSKVMITDFGLAHTRKAADMTTMDTICGTPEYIAPEMVAWQSYTSAVDLWAVGVIAYIVLRGDFPFYDQNRRKLYKKILGGKYSMEDEVWEKVSECGRDFVSRLLEVDPALRMTAAQALTHPWLRTRRHATQEASGAGAGETWSCRSSSPSSESGRSGTSLRTGRRRVRPRDLQGLPPRPPDNT